MFIGVSTWHFPIFNTTSVQYIIGAAKGYFGPEAREKGIYFMSKYIKWRKKKPEYYVPKTGMEPMYSAHDMEKDLECIKRFTPNYEDKEGIFTEYIKYKESIIDSIIIEPEPPSFWNRIYCRLTLGQSAKIAAVGK